jgi:hypothetical protein
VDKVWRGLLGRRRDERESTTTGGLEFPRSAKEAPAQIPLPCIPVVRLWSEMSPRLVAQLPQSIMPPFGRGG